MSFAPLFFNKLPPGLRLCPLKTVLKRGLGIFFPEMKTINRMLSIESNNAVCTSFFNRLPPGHINSPLKTVFLK